MKLPPSPGHNNSGEDWYVNLERLAQRHELGELTDDEFAREKRRILKKSHRQKKRAGPLEILAVTYTSEAEARSAYDGLRQVNQDVGDGIVHAAVLTKEMSGKVRILEFGQVTTGWGGRRATVIGVMARVIFPPSFVVGAESGSEHSALVQILSEQGFYDSDLRALGDSVKPGQSAIIAVAHTQSASELVRRLQGYNCFTVHALPPEIASALLEA